MLLSRLAATDRTSKNANLTMMKWQIRAIMGRTGSLRAIWLRSRVGLPEKAPTTPDGPGDRCQGGYLANDYCRLDGEYAVDRGPDMRIEVFRHSGDDWTRLSLGEKIGQTRVFSDMVDRYLERNGQYLDLEFEQPISVQANEVIVFRCFPTTDFKGYITFNQNTGRRAFDYSREDRNGRWMRNVEGIWNRARIEFGMGGCSPNIFSGNIPTASQLSCRVHNRKCKMVR